MQSLNTATAPSDVRLIQIYQVHPEQHPRSD